MRFVKTRFHSNLGCTVFQNNCYIAGKLVAVASLLGIARRPR